MGTLLLFILLTLLIALAAALGGAATALFIVNRFRLRHRVRAGARAARAAEELLADPGRLAVLLTLVQSALRVAAAGVALRLGLLLGGAPTLVIAGALCALGLALLAEMLPRAAAVQHPERWALSAAPALLILDALLAPFTRLLMLAQRVLLGGATRTRAAAREHRVHARAAAAEAERLLPAEARRDLADQLAAETATVADVMVPRTEVLGIDLDADWPDVLRRLRETNYRALPAYRGNVDQIEGVLDTHRLLSVALGGELTPQALTQALVAPYFVPASTSLPIQLAEFQRMRRDLALAVDEYGEVQGLVTLADVVAELAGTLAPGARGVHRDARPERDGSFLVAGSASVRSLNRALGWTLPADGPRTLNGLILEFLESIPPAGTSFRIGDYTMEIVQATGSTVRVARVIPPQGADPRE